LPVPQAGTITTKITCNYNTVCLKYSIHQSSVTKEDAYTRTEVKTYCADFKTDDENMQKTRKE
jgi:hypothetical protein